MQIRAEEVNQDHDLLSLQNECTLTKTAFLKVNKL